MRSSDKPRMTDAEPPLAQAFRSALISENGKAPVADALRSISDEIAKAHKGERLTFVTIAALLSNVLVSAAMKPMTSDDLRGALGRDQRRTKALNAKNPVKGNHAQGSPQPLAPTADKMMPPVPAAEKPRPATLGRERTGSATDDIIRRAERRQRIQDT